MAARTLKPRHQDDVRAKIQASQLINVLTNHALGKKLLEKDSQVNAALGLLRKVVPDLAAMEITDRREGWIDALRRVNGERLPAEVSQDAVAELPKPEDAAPQEVVVESDSCDHDAHVIEYARLVHDSTI